MKHIALLALASTGCIALSHEQLLESDSNENGIPDSAEWVELVGTDGQQLSRFAFADLDGDGFDDVIVSSPRPSSSGGRAERSGAVMILYGRATRPGSPFALTGADAELVGSRTSITTLGLGTGDFDCDGFDDVAIAFGDVVTGWQDATLHVLYGSPERLSGLGALDSVGSVIAGSFGYPLGAGDLDGDDCDELLLGFEGRSFVVRGRASPLAAGPFSPDAVFEGTLASAGGSAHTTGDLDGDGARDLVIGDQLMPEESVRANVFYGPIAWGTHTTAEASASLEISSGWYYGMLSGFDADADGRDELALTAGWPEDGELLVVSGNATRLAGATMAADLASASIVGAHAGDLFGAALTAGDADGDGRDEILVGAPNFRQAGRPVGRVYRFDGPIAAVDTDDASATWQGRLVPHGHGFADGVYAETLGASLASGGDFDGDGFDDTLMAAPSDVIPDGGARARLVFGAAPPAE